MDDKRLYSYSARQAVLQGRAEQHATGMVLVMSDKVVPITGMGGRNPGTWPDNAIGKSVELPGNWEGEEETPDGFFLPVDRTFHMGVGWRVIGD